MAEPIYERVVAWRPCIHQRLPPIERKLAGCKNCIA